MPENPRPSGTVAFLFTDIEGSTKRWQAHAAAMGDAVARHDALLRQAIEVRGGYVFKTVGDAFCAAFATAPLALAAALEAQRGLGAVEWGALGPLRVRMGIHVGAAEEREGDYFGPAVNRVARLLSAGHGGQVLLSLPAEELVRDSLPADALLRDMGEHRLKDLERPERIFQLVVPDLPADFLPLATLDRRPHNLPVHLTPFIGRDTEVAAARERLEREDVHLLTLTGPGGTGKTRLALQVAAEVLDSFDDGAWFVPLEQATTLEAVVGAIAQALGVRDATGHSLEQTLTEHLRLKSMLLVLDNFEQVASAAPLLVRLARAAPNVKLLVSSRVRLRVYGEHELAVPPLGLPGRATLPPVDELTRFEAVRLFVERAQAVRADFAIGADNAQAVVDICHALDGLPLAIELAAARIRLLPPQAMLGRLQDRLKLLVGGGQDRPERQQTLRGAIAWSHDLLPPAEQTLFARLAVFASGCTLESAEAVTNPDGDLDVLAGLEALVDHSLIRWEEAADGEPRFAMLATIRAFARERLETDWSEEAALTAKRHADHFLGFAEQAAAGLAGPEQVSWLERLAAEGDNLRAALNWYEANGAAEQGIRLITVSRRYWWTRGVVGEVRDQLSRLLDRETGVPGRVLADGLSAAGWFAWAQADYDPAHRFLEKALRVYESTKDQEGQAYAYGLLGLVARDQGEYVLAEALFQDSLAHARETGDQLSVVAALNWLGTLAFNQGQYDRAAAWCEENLALSRRLGNRQEVAFALYNLAETRHHQGDLERALGLYQEVLPLFREMDDRAGAAQTLFGLGRIAASRRDAAQADELLREGLAIAREAGDQALVAGFVEGLAGAAAIGGDARGAAELFGAAEALREAIGAPLPPAYQAERDAHVALARAGVDAEAFAAAWAAGRAAPLDEAIGAPPRRG